MTFSEQWLTKDLKNNFCNEWQELKKICKKFWKSEYCSFQTVWIFFLWHQPLFQKSSPRFKPYIITLYSMFLKLCTLGILLYLMLLCPELSRCTYWFCTLLQHLVLLGILRHLKCKWTIQVRKELPEMNVIIVRVRADVDNSVHVEVKIVEPGKWYLENCYYKDQTMHEEISVISPTYFNIKY